MISSETDISRSFSSIINLTFPQTKYLSDVTWSPNSFPCLTRSCHTHTHTLTHPQSWFQHFKHPLKTNRMSNRKLPELKLFPAMFKYECLVRLLACVFMAVWYHYDIVMNVCRIMGDSAGDTNGLEFCNCRAAVREGRKLPYPPPARTDTSVTHPQSSGEPRLGGAISSEAGWWEKALCDWTGVKSPGVSWSCLVWLGVHFNLDYRLCCADLNIFFPFLFERQLEMNWLGCLII